MRYLDGPQPDFTRVQLLGSQLFENSLLLMRRYIGCTREVRSTDVQFQRRKIEGVGKSRG